MASFCGYNWFLLSLASVAMTTTDVEPNIYDRDTTETGRHFISFHMESAQQYAQLASSVQSLAGVVVRIDLE